MRDGRAAAQRFRRRLAFSAGLASVIAVGAAVAWRLLQ